MKMKNNVSKMQDRITRLIQSHQHLLSIVERKSLVRSGYAEWVKCPTPDHPHRKLLRFTEKCPTPDIYRQ